MCSDSIEEFLRCRGQVLHDLTSNYRDKASLIALCNEYRSTDSQVAKVVSRMYEFVTANLSGTGIPCPDNEAENAPYIVDLYDQIYEATKRDIEAELASLETEHASFTHQYFQLPPLAQQVALSTLHKLERRIAECRSRLEPLAHHWDQLIDTLTSTRERIATARVALANGSLRQQAQALRNAIERVDLFYEPVGMVKSQLVRVKVVPIIGEPQEYEGSSVVLR